MLVVTSMVWLVLVSYNINCVLGSFLPMWLNSISTALILARALMFSAAEQKAEQTIVMVNSAVRSLTIKDLENSFLCRIYWIVSSEKNVWYIVVIPFIILAPLVDRVSMGVIVKNPMGFDDTILGCLKHEAWKVAFVIEMGIQVINLAFLSLNVWKDRVRWS